MYSIKYSCSMQSALLNLMIMLIIFSVKNCEAETNTECLDMVCNEQCSQCKNYRVSTAVAKIDEKYANETCVLSEDRKCVLEGWCQAEFRFGS